MKTTKLIGKAIMAVCLCLGMAACGDDNGDNPGGGGGDHGGPGSRLKFTELAFEGGDNRYYKFNYRASDLYSWPYVLNHYSYSFSPDGSRHYIDYTYTMGATGGTTIKTDYGRTCEVNPDGLVIHYTHSASTPPYQTLEEALFTYDDNRQLKEMTWHFEKGYERLTKFTWKNGNITKVECINPANGETVRTDTYTYTSEPSWKGITFISGTTNDGITNDTYMDMLFYTGEYFGKRPKNLIASRKRGDNTVKFEYTYYTAPHPAEGYVYETKLDDDITYTFTWEGTAE